MSPRVAYWCSSFDTDMEAIASEVATLRQAFPKSVTWGISARNWLSLSRRRGFGIHPRAHLLFRGLTRLVQQCYDVQHLFGGLGDWFHLRAVRKKPVVLTVAVESNPCDVKLLHKVDKFVVEWPGAEERIVALGIERKRVQVILPPVDLVRFAPTPPPSGPFTVCFASSPERSDWLQARGVDLILDAASKCSDYRFQLVWRPWGDSLAKVQEWIGDRRLTNVELIIGKFSNMSEHYGRAHVTVTPFVDMNRCKPMPNSAVESLACGRPIVVTAGVGIADLVLKHKAGLVAGSSGADLADALRTIEGGWSSYSSAARSLAEQCFSTQIFVQSYRQLYQELL
jgi:glycosyltransferase involved in cell wall biosynthesis